MNTNAREAWQNTNVPLWTRIGLYAQQHHGCHLAPGELREAMGHHDAETMAHAHARAKQAGLVHPDSHARRPLSTIPHPNGRCHQHSDGSEGSRLKRDPDDLMERTRQLRDEWQKHKPGHLVVMAADRCYLVSNTHGDRDTVLAVMREGIARGETP